MLETQQILTVDENIHQLNKLLAGTKPTQEEIDYAIKRVDEQVIRQAFNASRRTQGLKEEVKQVVNRLFNREYGSLGKFTIDEEGLFAAYSQNKRTPYVRTFYKDGKINYIGNSAYLYNWKLQRILEQLIPMIPFNLFNKHELNNINFIDQHPSEIIDCFRFEAIHPMAINVTNMMDEGNHKKIPEQRHFTGARLYSVGDKYYLLDLDRQELEYGIFNAFVVQLPKPVATIKEAYDSLKPEIVRRAEANGMEVKRQGGFYFIPLTNDEQNALNHAIELKKGDVLQDKFIQPNQWSRDRKIENLFILGLFKDDFYFPERRSDDGERVIWEAGYNSHMFGSELQAKASFTQYRHFVKGYVKFFPTEHKQVNLETWHRLIPNCSAGGLTLNNKVD